MAIRLGPTHRLALRLAPRIRPVIGLAQRTTQYCWASFLATLCLVGSPQCNAELPRTRAELGHKVAEQLVDDGVFGDAAVGRTVLVHGASVETASVGSDVAWQLKVLEERVRLGLRKRLPPNCSILTARETKNRFPSRDVDPRQLAVDDEFAVGVSVKKLGVDIVVTLSLDVVDIEEMRTRQENALVLNVTATARFSDGSPKQACVVSAEPRAVGWIEPWDDNGDKFDLKLTSGDQPVKLMRCGDAGSQYYNVLFADFSNLVDEAGSLRVTLHLSVEKPESSEGGKTFNPIDDGRLYPVEANINGEFVTAVDGEAVQEVEGVAVYALSDINGRSDVSTTKYVCLTNGGSKTVLDLPSNGRAFGGRALRIDLSLPAGTTSHKFGTFAELLGVTVSPGVISVRIYSYRLQDDTRDVVVPQPSMPGIQDTFGNHIHGLPVHEFRIVYASDGQFPVAVESLADAVADH